MTPKIGVRSIAARRTVKATFWGVAAFAKTDSKTCIDTVLLPAKELEITFVTF